MSGASRPAAGPHALRDEPASGVAGRGAVGAPVPGNGRAPVWKAAFFTLAAFAIVAGVAWALLGSSFLVVRTVEVTGTGPLVSRTRVLGAAGIPRGLPLIRINASDVAHRVEGIRQVLSARVRRHWPDTVVISVRVRTPVFAVKRSAGYALIDRFGVDVRQSAHPAGLPLLTAPAPPPGADSLRGNAAVHAAAVVLGELPGKVATQVRKVAAANSSDVSVRLAGGVQIIWGDTSHASQKARELTLLMRTHARLYDVSAPGTAVTRG